MKKPCLQFTPCCWENLLLSTSSAEHCISEALSEDLLSPLTLALFYSFLNRHFSISFPWALFLEIVVWFLSLLSPSPLSFSHLCFTFASWETRWTYQAVADAIMQEEMWYMMMSSCWLLETAICLATAKKCYSVWFKFIVPMACLFIFS